MQTSNNSASFKRRYSYISIKVPLVLFRSENSWLRAFWRMVSPWVRLRKDWISAYRLLSSSLRSLDSMGGFLWRKHSIGEVWLLGISQKRHPRRKVIDNRTSSRRKEQCGKQINRTASIRCCQELLSAGQMEVMWSITLQLSWVLAGMAGI